MATSYISEHSAEYSLVPALKSLLEAEFEFVVPVFPWITREISKISMLLHKNDRFHILVMFPRRPKISGVNDSTVYVTINRELESYKEVGSEHGVPVIAGCLKASDFWELAKCSEHIWLEIGHPELQEYLISVESLTLGTRSPRLDDEAVIALVKESRIHDIGGFDGFLRKARYSQPHRMYGAQYKPVYFLVKTH